MFPVAVIDPPIVVFPNVSQLGPPILKSDGTIVLFRIIKLVIDPVGNDSVPVAVRLLIVAVLIVAVLIVVDVRVLFVRVWTAPVYTIPVRVFAMLNARMM
jgi:hypothetical protein